MTPVADRLALSSRCPKGLTAAGCTDSSSSCGRTRPSGERRKSGGTQEHAASAPHRSDTARTDREDDPQPLVQRDVFAKNGSILPPLDYRRGSKSKADGAELAGGVLETGYCHPDGKGWTLIMSDRFSGKVFPSPSGIASHGKWIAVRQQQPSGALRGAILELPNEATFCAPSDIPWPIRRWTLNEDHTTGR
ncbi:hypothetical protein RMR16_001775 [Agrobacterium sp. rho-13.3]|uniref:hypothetical protein n=1 Tax=Agrobacterium sp. rho-13.3 TaxID=3072980 RepID=UPI003D7AC77D